MTSSVLDHPRLEQFSRPSRVTAEGLALAAVTWALWTLAGNFGGVDIRDAVRGLAPLLLALPAAARGLQHLSVRAGVVVALMPVGLAASLVMAAFRSDAAAPLLTYTAMLVAGLATVAVVRTSWGPRALAVVALAVGTRSWWVGFEVWYGSSLNEFSTDRWMALPWHNQSGILMAAVALAFAVAAATSERSWSWLLGMGAAGAAGAAWLSASRGSVIALLIGVAIAVAVTPRAWRGWLAMGAGAFGFVLVLTGLPGSAATDPGPSLAAAESSSARVAHWQAAAGMFFDDPVTGQGVGSYRLASGKWAPGSANPSAHAHNEFIELAAEGGLLLAVPAALIVLGLAVAAVRRLRSSGRDRAAATASVVWLSLVTHALIDFDWLFPLLALAFAVTGGLVAITPGTGKRWPVFLVGAAFVISLGAAYVEGFQRTEGVVHPPWNSSAASSLAQQAISVGDTDRAVAIATSAQAWNPGDPQPAVWKAVAAIDTDGPRSVVVAAERAEPGFGVRLDAAATLLDLGAAVEARELVTGTIGDFDAYPGWHLAGAAAVAYRLQVQIAGELEGCESAREAALIALGRPLASEFGGENYMAEAEVYCR